MAQKIPTVQALLQESRELRARLEEAESTLRAIRGGEVDALVVEGSVGPRIYTLQGVDAESNRFRGEILAQIGETVLAVDQDQRIIYLNSAAERLYGVTPGEALGHNLTELYELWPAPQGHDRDMTLPRHERAPWRSEQVHRTRDGRELQVELSDTPLLDSAGQLAGRLSVIRDITNRKGMEQALRASEERFRALAGQLEQQVEERTRELVQSQDRLRLLATELNLAEQRERKRLAGELHDYLAQLLVLGCLKLGLARGADLPSKAEKMVKEAEEVLSQALAYSRTLMAELSPPVLQHGLPAGLKWLGEYMQRQGLMVHVEVGDASGMSLSYDCTVLLFQSVRELLMNALKHACSQKVVVRLQEEERRLWIEVRDDGVGFDLAAAAAAPTAMSSKFGIFSIRERMTALGGWFDMQSAPGEGTTATLLLPLTLDTIGELGMRNDVLPEMNAVGHYSGHSPLNKQLSTLHQQNAKIRVLLVDDHAMMRQGLKSVLESYEDITVVGEAGDGEAAIVVAARLRPDIVVMDINMPRMNGIEATAHIKVQQPEVIVIGMSVQAGGVYEEAMRKAGAVTVLPKEAAVEELYRTIQKALSPNPSVIE